MKRKLKRKFKVILFWLCLVFLSVFLILIFRKYYSFLDRFFLNINFFPEKTELINPVVARFNGEEAGKKLSEAGISFSFLEEKDNLITFKTEDNWRVIFSREKDLKWQVESLKNLLAKFAGQEKKPSQISFEFDMPLVKF